MKKNLVFVAIIGLVIATLSGCGSESGSGSTSSEGPKGISEKEKKELVKNQNYKKACELKEFSTAYEIVDNLKKETSRNKVFADKHADDAAKRAVLCEGICF